MGMERLSMPCSFSIVAVMLRRDTQPAAKHPETQSAAAGRMLLLPGRCSGLDLHVCPAKGMGQMLRILDARLLQEGMWPVLLLSFEASKGS